MMTLQTARADLLAPDALADALIALHDRTVDAASGYARMVEKAEPSFRSVVESFRALHATQADRLARMLAGLGREADPDGTFMGTVNVAVVSVRALVDRIDADVMDNIRQGEASVLAAFETALAATSEPAMTTELARMRDALIALLDHNRRPD